MFLQFSPPKAVKKQPVVKKKIQEKTEILSLAPFAVVPKLYFEDIPVGNTSTCKLIIRNSTDQQLTIFLTKKLPADFNVTYNWEQKDIEEHSDVLFELTWHPISKESSYQKISFETTDGTQRNVPIIFKSVLPKKKNVGKTKQFKKSPTKKYYSRKSSNVPTKRYSLSPNKNATVKKKAVSSSPFSDIKTDPWDPFISTVNREFKEPLGVNFGENREITFPKEIDKHFDFGLTSTPQRFNLDIPSPMPQINQTSSFANWFQSGESNKENVNVETADSLDEVFNNSLSSLRAPPTPLLKPYLQNIREEKSETSFGTYYRQCLKPKSPTTDFEYKLQHLDSMCLSEPKELFQMNQCISESMFEETPEQKSNTYIKDSTFRTYVKDSSFGSIFRNPAIVLDEASFMNPLEELNTQANVNSDGRLTFCLDYNAPFKKMRQDLRVNKTRGPSNWSKAGDSAFRVHKSTTGLKLNKKDGSKEVKSLSVEKTCTATTINPFLMAASGCDPFLTQTYINDEWVAQQENNFKKWLNALLTPPQEFSYEDKPIDIAKVWQECKNMDIESASSKEEVSSKYHVNSKLIALRKSARTLFKSEAISKILLKVSEAVEKGRLSVRQDKDIFLNLTTKSELMALVLSYTPLWLRIGLETVYNETIPLKSNSDVEGLGNFIVNRLFKDPLLLRRYKSTYSPKYVENFNKFFLKKFLTLVYFLDQAKNGKLIQHDPCLFRRASKIKETKGLLVVLAREALAGVGDISKQLKLYGYVVTHVQTSIHEFDYTVNILGVDLRDGVRLTKIMELILIKNDLMNNLRVPAISRLQKIHNMKIVFECLEQAGYKMLGDISPKDIVDGHKEKTLSFLWQLIYKFEAPLMVKSATTIQTWFRSLPVALKRRKIDRAYRQRLDAAKKIQKWYRRRILSNKLLAVVEIIRQLQHEIKLERAAATIQRRWIAKRLMLKERSNYLRLRESCMCIQVRWKAMLLQREERRRYLLLKRSAILIQQKWRAQQLMLIERNAYVNLKTTVVTIQRRWRSNYLMREERAQYLRTKKAVTTIQRKWRATRCMLKHRNDFIRLKNAATLIQKKWSAVLQGRKQKQVFMLLKSATITIQTAWRNRQLAVKTRNDYITLRTAVITIQTKWKAVLLGRKIRSHFLLTKQKAIVIQQYWKCRQLAVKSRNDYLELKEASAVIQKRWRAKLLGRKELERFKNLKQATVTIQRIWRANQLMISNRNDYIKLRNATLVIQRRLRAMLLGKKERHAYIQLKQSAIILQQRWTARKLMIIQRNYYHLLLTNVVKIQRNRRAICAGREQREAFLKLKQAAITIQQHWRAREAMINETKHYNLLKRATILIQRRFRATLLMTKEKNHYLLLKESTILIQTKWRATKLMSTERQKYLTIRNAIITIQAHWKAILLGKQQQQHYTLVKKSVIIIQRKWRATQLMHEERHRYIQLKASTIRIQQMWRATISYREQRTLYLSYQKAAVIIQRRWRAAKLMIEERNKFIRLINSCALIQNKWRATLASREERRNFLLLKHATSFIQQKFRSKQLMIKDRDDYLRVKRAVAILQPKWRATISSRKQRAEFLSQKNAAITIQRWYRNFLLTKRERREYLLQKEAIIGVQKIARGYLIRSKYSEYLSEEAKAKRRVERLQAQAAVKIQSFWRGYTVRCRNQPKLTEIRKRFKNGLLKPSKTLENKCEFAVTSLLGNVLGLDDILALLTDIDYASRRSEKLCVYLSNRINEKLYTLLCVVNRSLPDTQISTLSVNILINFNKLESTRKDSFLPKYIDQLVVLMMNFCDKEAQLFPSLCTLMWLFARTPSWKRFILNLPNIQQRLKRIEALVLRKKNMVSRQAGKKSFFAAQKNLYVPSNVPDWGLEYKNKPYIFTNSVHAFNCLMGVLFD
ncbi:unnamed protein product [Phyllotreta striolata]|uniref:Calponin-homology (CH) domain-containing protein n=1 Tax=Phyllotreta striolata TaxID=444603 RepID=A0A9N9TF47_PHYSR|nr:unnamed protein product [Phyllotreta striolata]